MTVCIVFKEDVVNESCHEYSVDDDHEKSENRKQKHPNDKYWIKSNLNYYGFEDLAN